MYILYLLTVVVCEKGRCINQGKTEISAQRFPVIFSKCLFSCASMYKCKLLTKKHFTNVMTS